MPMKKKLRNSLMKKVRLKMHFFRDGFVVM